MASFARRRSPAAVWSVEDAASFAVMKEFKLLQLLSTDKKALATGRRLGYSFQQPQPQYSQCFRCCYCYGRLSRVDCWCGIGVCRAKREEEAKRSAKCAASRFSTSMAKVEPLHYRCALHSEAAARCPRAGPTAGPGRHRHNWQRSSAFVGNGAGGGWVETTRPPSFNRFFFRSLFCGFKQR